MTTPDPSRPSADDSPTSPYEPPPAPPVGAPAGPAGAWTAPPVPPPGVGWAERARPTAPAQTSQPGLVAGIVLVVIGVVLLAIRVLDTAIGADAWPLWLIVPGVAMVAGSLAIPPRGGLGLAIPGTIIAIVGGILWVQQTYGLYATWAYTWALVAPTGPGLAMLLYGVARGDHDTAREGFRATLAGLALFGGFAFFFEGVVGLSGHRIQNLDQVMPYLAIGLGLLLVVGSLVGGRTKGRPRS